MQHNVRQHYWWSGLAEHLLPARGGLNVLGWDLIPSKGLVLVGHRAIVMSLAGPIGSH
jgi:hypothetical protein